MGDVYTAAAAKQDLAGYTFNALQSRLHNRHCELFRRHARLHRHAQQRLTLLRSLLTGFSNLHSQPPHHVKARVPPVFL